MDTIHQRIKKRRTQLGLTLLELADKLGVKEATVQRYESGEIKNIKHQTVVQLSKILKCNPAYLMGWIASPNSTYIDIDNGIIMYHKLDNIDKSEICGEMKQMLKADKYKNKNDIVATARIVAYGGDDEVITYNEEEIKRIHELEDSLYPEDDD